MALRPYADDAEKAARVAAFATIAEEQIRATRCAKFAADNFPGQHAGIEQLPAIGGEQIQLNAWRRRIVSGRCHRQPLQRIRFFT